MTKDGDTGDSRARAASLLKPPHSWIRGAAAALATYAVMWMLSTLLSSGLRIWHDDCIHYVFAQPSESTALCSPAWYVVASALTGALRLGPAVILAYWTVPGAIAASAVIYVVSGALSFRAKSRGRALVILACLLTVWLSLGLCQAMLMWLGGS